MFFYINFCMKAMSIQDIQVPDVNGGNGLIMIKRSIRHEPF